MNMGGLKVNHMGSRTVVNYSFRVIARPYNDYIKFVVFLITATNIIVVGN